MPEEKIGLGCGIGVFKGSQMVNFEHSAFGFAVSQSGRFSLISTSETLALAQASRLCPNK